MKIAIYGKSNNDGHHEDLCRLMSLVVETAGADAVVIHPKFHHFLATQLPQAMPPRVVVAGEEDDFTADIALSIGGDGTFLRTVRYVAHRGIPVLGINTGHLGYLADLSLAEAVAMERLPYKFKREHRTLLHVEGAELPSNIWPYALNEVALLKTDTSSMLSASASVNGTPLTTYLADGLIIATPTGSTGYNLSVGGPIIAPTTQAIVLSPVAPHSLTMRPLVVDDRAVIEVTTDARAESYLLSLDGHSVTMRAGSTVRVSRARFTVAVVQRAGHHFAATLRNKLLWGQSR